MTREESNRRRIAAARATGRVAYGTPTTYLTDAPPDPARERTDKLGRIMKILGLDDQATADDVRREIDRLFGVSQPGPNAPPQTPAAQAHHAEVRRRLAADIARSRKSR